MTWRVHLDTNRDFFSRSVRLLIADFHPDGSYSVLGADGVVTRYAADTSAPDDLAAIEIPSDALPSLLAAVSRHLGAVEHPEQLRRDYDAERARVDRLIGHLIGGAA